MYILGLNLLHDTSAALLSDGSIVGAVEEKRFTCVKDTDCTPEDAIRTFYSSGLDAIFIDNYLPTLV